MILLDEVMISGSVQYMRQEAGKARSMKRQRENDRGSWRVYETKADIPATFVHEEIRGDEAEYQSKKGRKKKIYAIYDGNKPGVYWDWDTAQPYTVHKKANHRGFPDEQLAWNYFKFDEWKNNS